MSDIDLSPEDLDPEEMEMHPTLDWVEASPEALQALFPDQLGDEDSSYPRINQALSAALTSSPRAVGARVGVTSEHPTGVPVFVKYEDGKYSIASVDPSLSIGSADGNDGDDDEDDLALIPAPKPASVDESIKSLVDDLLNESREEVRDSKIENLARAILGD